MSATTDLVFVQRRYLDLLAEHESLKASSAADLATLHARLARAEQLLRRIAAEPFDWPAWVEDLDAAIGGAR